MKLCSNLKFVFIFLFYNITGWEKFNTSFYRIFMFKKSWNDSKMVCESHGGYLAEVSSAGENDFIVDLIKKKDINPGNMSYVWLGGADKGHEGKWNWAKSGEVIHSETTFSNWYKDHIREMPDNHDGNENCLNIWKTYRWNDAPCDEKNFFACEHD